MNPRLLILATGVSALLATTGASAAPLANQLKHHASPYLAMHAADPVAWQDWNRDVLERARREGKLVYLSIGYFSCHWCHVMQRESYRNAEIARFLNDHFIPVKIDRELEPALDQRLIEFAEKTRGQGGWPLNVFLTPEGHPLYAVLYQPPGEFLDGVRKLQALWRQEPAKLKQLARQEAVKSEGPGKPVVDARQALGYAHKAVAGALSIADSVHGGFGEQSKFPSVPPLEFLLAQHQRQPNSRLAEFLVLTLDQMANGGLYDHVGGGFFRYTVDPSWKTPHFEKMLYDNALLARLYLRAARVFGRGDYAQVARATLDFMARELASGEDALIASLSAVDDKDVEGGYYLWSTTELEKLLPKDERELYRRVYGMTDAAPFEAGYLPLRAANVADAAKALGIEADEAARRLASARQRLRLARTARVVPRDTKQLAGWNGLALTAFAEAAVQLHETRYRDTAQAIRDYLVNRLWDGKALKRALAGGRALGAVSLEDYAYVAEGLHAWAEVTGRIEDYRLAQTVAEAGWARHYGRQGWRLSADGLIDADSGQDLVADGPMPAPSAVLARASLALARRTGNHKLRDRALSALNSGHKILGEDPYWYASHIAAMLAAVDEISRPNGAPGSDPGAVVGSAGNGTTAN
jgi:hypothetical protein